MQMAGPLKRSRESDRLRIHWTTISIKSNRGSVLVGVYPKSAPGSADITIIKAHLKMESTSRRAMDILLFFIGKSIGVALMIGVFKKQILVTY